MESLYIEGKLDNNKNSITCSLSSGVVIFVHQYSQPEAIPVHAVNRSGSSINRTSSNLCESLSTVELSIPPGIVLDSADENPHVEQCCLPSAVLHHGLVFTSGLCSVLRHVIKTSHAQTPLRALISLLGHKSLCLKSCAEVSPWTKFCEIQIIRATENLLCSKGVNGENEASVLPEEIQILENHLKEPPIIPNKGKKRLELQKAAAKNENGESCTEETIQRMLEHNFAEGIEFTLTDLILYFCVHICVVKVDSFFCQLKTEAPKVLDWYERVGSKTDVIEALQKVGLDKGPGLSDLVQIINVPSNDSTERKVTGKRSVNEKRHGKKKFKATPPEITKALDDLGLLGLGIPAREHPRQGSVQLPWDSYPPAVHPQEGELPADRVQRKCEQLESLATAVQTVARPSDRIVDFCSGGGHLGILLAYLLPTCHVVLVENKEESIMRAVARVETLQLTNVSIYQTNLDYFTGDFDVGVCLHACGGATDLVLGRCLQQAASFVICPCCYGSIRPTHTLSYPRSAAFRESGVGYEKYRVLAHGGDQTQVATPAAVLGKQCMVGVDSDRARLAMEHGYNVTLCSLQPETCSPKNNILIGVPNA